MIKRFFYAVMFGITLSNAYLGRLKLNPFNFQNLAISSLTLTHNGVQYPTDMFKPNFSKDLFMREYR